MATIRFIPISGRYRVDDRAVPKSAVRRGVDRLADLASGRAAELTDDLLAGRIPVGRWQAEMMALSKDALIAAAVVAKGGRERMTASDWGFVGRRLRDEYDYIRRFALQLASGATPRDGKAVTRAKMYGQQARVVYEQVRAREERHLGYDQERNALDAAAESCDQCLTLSKLGWVGLGTLPPIGARTCLSNCRCTIERRIAAAVVEAFPTARAG